MSSPHTPSASSAPAHRPTARFSTRSRELISLSGAIVSLKSFRPSISWLPSLLEGNQRSCGPFAPAVPLEATLLLQIESFEVLGSINEVIFWDTTALQATLLQHARPEAKLFQRWFQRVEKAMIREHKRAERVASYSKQANSSASQAVEERSSDGGPSGSAASAALSSLPPPPPFQQPAWPRHRQPVKRQRDSSSGPGSSAPSTQSKRAKLDAAWGDFSLSHLDDEFGLDAAASQLLERHTQGQGSALDDSTDRLFPSLSSYDSLLGGEMLSDDDGEREIDGNAAIDVQSSAATLPPTYPLNVLEAGAAQALLGEGSTVRPPSITDTTSLPFSFLLDGEAEAVETEAEGAARPEHDDRQQGDADATHTDASFHSKHAIGPTIHPWKTVRRVSAEQRKDYERRYRSQMHNITD